MKKPKSVRFLSADKKQIRVCKTKKSGKKVCKNKVVATTAAEKAKFLKYQKNRESGGQGNPLESIDFLPRKKQGKNRTVETT